MYIYIYVHNPYVCIYVHIYLYIPIYVYVYAYIDRYVYLYIYVHIYIYIHIYIIHISVYLHIYMCIYPYMYTCTHISMNHACVWYDFFILTWHMTYLISLIHTQIVSYAYVTMPHAQSCASIYTSVTTSRNSVLQCVADTLSLPTIGVEN